MDLAELPYAAAFAGLAGILVGSFVNVLIHRIPQGLSIVRPRSRCPRCGHEIATRDNVPIVSWLLLHGRCRSCREPIPVRYPVVEGATGIVWAVLTWWALGATGVPGLLPLLLVLGAAGVALWMIDLDHHRLPDAIVLPLYPVTLVGLVTAGIIEQRWSLASAGIGIGVWTAVVGVPWLISGGRGMGFGDVKLAPVLGATLGWVAVSAAVTGLLAAFVLGASVGLALLVAGRAGRRTQVPFGPFLLAGALVGLLAGPAIAEVYLGYL